MRRRSFRYWGFLTGFVLLIYAGVFCIPSTARRAMPWRPFIVHEFYEESGFTGDFMRGIKAKLSEPEYRSFIKTMELTRVCPHDPRSREVSWVGPDNANWWDPPKSMDGAYFEISDSGNYFQVAKYDKGHLYFSELKF